jgi:hypothetical protein
LDVKPFDKLITEMPCISEHDEFKKNHEKTRQIQKNSR